MLQVMLSRTQVLHSWMQVHSAQIQLTARTSYHLGSVTSERNATSIIAMRSYKSLFTHWLSYKQPECNKYLHGSVTRYITPDIIENSIYKI